MSTSDLGHRSIRTRRTLLPDGRVETVETVLCPRWGRSASTTACDECGFCSGIFRDHDDRFALCALPYKADFTQHEHLAAMMTDDIECVRKGVRLDELRRLLISRDQQALPVVDERGRPIGIVSRVDVLPFNIDDRRLASEVMTSFATTVSELASPEEAAALMALEGVHQLPVVSAGLDRTVVGTVSALDVARWIARDRGYLAPARP
jgi:CBS domain-containing protein